MRLKRILTLTAPLLLYGAAKALAAASGTPIDAPVTTYGQIMSGPVASGLLWTGAGMWGYHAITGREMAHLLGNGVTFIVGGAACAAPQALATSVFNAAGATIELVSHPALHAAAQLTARFLA